MRLFNPMLFIAGLLVAVSAIIAGSYYSYYSNQTISVAGVVSNVDPDGFTNIRGRVLHAVLVEVTAEGLVEPVIKEYSKSAALPKVGDNLSVTVPRRWVRGTIDPAVVWVVSLTLLIAGVAAMLFGGLVNPECSEYDRVVGRC